MPAKLRSRSRYPRVLARLAGFDLFTHMAGGGGFPIRAWSVRSVQPLRTRRLSIPATFQVDIEDCTSFVGFSFRTGGWNPHVETVRELLRDPSLKYEDSPLARLYETFRPRTLQDLFLEEATETFEPLSSVPATRAMFRYVWALSPSRMRAVAATSSPEGHHYFGPQDALSGHHQFNRLREVLVSIQTHGFRPDTHGMISGYFLTDGVDHRFVVGAGNHRLAVLKGLGPKIFPASLLDSHPAVIHRSRLHTWSTARGGPFHPGTAEVLFDKLMNEDGLLKARNLRLVP